MKVFRKKEQTVRFKQGRAAVGFLWPFMLLFVLFRVVPSLASIGISFTHWSIIGKPSFAGFDNYVRLAKDPSFWTAFRQTLYFILLTTPALLVLAMCFALMLNKELRGKGILRTCIFIPYVLTPSIIGLIWNFLYNRNSGVINYLLSLLGIGKVGWLTNHNVAMISVAIVSVWWLVGYNTILLLTGLQNIPKEHIEVAHLDGANGWVTLFKIIIPELRPIITLVTTLTLINTIQIFDQIFAMTGGGPGDATMTLVQYLYNAGFINFNMSYSCTIGVIVLIMLIILVFAQNKLTKSEV